MASEIKTITSNAVIVHPDTFVFAAPADTDDVTINFDTFNLKLKHVCDHKLVSGTYRLANCPRCLGMGYYYDVKFNDIGKLVRIELTEHLAQTLEKLAITEENYFHPGVAINIQKWLGAAPISEIKAAIRFDIIKSLITIQEVQRGAPNLSSEVQIKRIDNVIVREDSSDPTRLYYIVQVTTISGVQRALEGIVILNR